MKIKGKPFVSLGLLIASWVMMRIELNTVSPSISAVVRSPKQKFLSPPNAFTSYFTSDQAKITRRTVEISDRRTQAPAFVALSDNRRQTPQKLSVFTSDILFPMPLPQFDKPLAKQIARDTQAPIVEEEQREQNWLAAPLPASNVRATGSFWLLARKGGTSFAGGRAGAIGDSQMGMRLVMPVVELGNTVSAGLSVRASTPIRGDGQELAIGISLKRSKRLAMELIAETRFQLNSNQADNLALIAVTGVSELPLGSGFHLDAFGQAGVVGPNQSTLFIGGNASIHKEVSSASGVSLNLGMGAWSDAQNGAERLDVGPELSLKFRNAKMPVRVSLQWRQRILGNASPNSGAALVLASDF